MDAERVKVGDVEYHTRSPRYYRCSNCMHEQDKRCSAKPGKPTVKLNKKRNSCKKFAIDDEKFVATEMKFKPIPIEQRPDWYWMTRNQKKRLAELLQSASAVPPAHLQRNIITPPDSEKLIWTPGDDVDES